MASWRPVRGHIQRLDPFLTTEEHILEFFREERILGRGKSDGEAGFEFELAIAGRRRRVATVDEEGEVFRGRSVNDLLELLEEKLRKIAVEIDGTILHGPFDMGVVAVSDDDLGIDEYDLVDVEAGEVPESEANGEGGAAPGRGAASTDETGQDPTSEEPDDGIYGPELPEFEAGPMLLVSDISMSEMPVMVNAEGFPISVSKLGDVRVIVAEESLDVSRKVFPRPSLSIALSTDRTKNENPMLVVRRDNSRLTWDWSGELPVFSWIEPGSSAEDFVIDELGAGAVARRAVMDIIDASFAEVRAALLVAPEKATHSFVEALGLPEQIADVLEGHATLVDIPESRIFTPGSAGETFEETLAWEIAGEGVVEPEIASAVRKLYLERPWAMSIVSALQAAIGGGMFARGLMKNPLGKRNRLAIVLGALGVVGSVSRILTVTYMGQVFDRSQPDIQQWRSSRNWHTAYPESGPDTTDE